eukprot:s5874_g6.t2
MPTLWPEPVALPNGPLLRPPSELLAAYKAGQAHEEHLMVAFCFALAVAGACLAFFAWRHRRPHEVIHAQPLDLEAQAAPVLAELRAMSNDREEIFTSMAAMQRRLSTEVERREHLEFCMEDAAEKVGWFLKWYRCARTSIWPYSPHARRQGLGRHQGLIRHPRGFEDVSTVGTPCCAVHELIRLPEKSNGGAQQRVQCITFKTAAQQRVQ